MLAYPYLPPEVTEGVPYSKAVDVYLFGELLLYTILQEPPVRATSTSNGNRNPEVPCPDEQCQSIPTQWCSWLSGVYRVSLGNALQLVRFLKSYVRDGLTLSFRLSRC